MPERKKKRKKRTRARARGGSPKIRKHIPKIKIMAAPGGIPKEIKDMLSGTQLITDEQVIRFWQRPHIFLGGKSPQEMWSSGQEMNVKAFVAMLKSGDGSMT